MENNYRLSSYTIFTRLEGGDDKYMLVHGYTGAMDVVSGNVVSCLKSQKECLELGNVCFSPKVFDVLAKRGYITQKTHEAELEYVCRMAQILHKKEKMLYKNFLFVVTYNCNFRCPYCYENEISNGGNNWSQATFTKGMVDKAYLAMMEIEPQRRLHSNIITLYGGEPLLSENREIVEYIVKKGSELGYKFSAITNGYDLNCYVDLLSDNFISHIQVTIDGSRVQHNKRRIHYKYGASFDKIIENIRMALERNIAVDVRVNTDLENFETLYELQTLFHELGFDANSRFSYYSAILKKIEKEAFTKRYNFRYAIRREYNRKHKLSNYTFDCQDFGLYENLSSSINDKKMINFSSIHCPAQSGEYIFDPCGAIYPCWEVIGVQKQSLGSYVHSPIQWTEALGLWHSRNVCKIKPCNSCKYAFLCNGGCAGNALYATGKLFSCYCDDFADTFAMTVNRVYQDYVSRHKNKFV